MMVKTIFDNPQLPDLSDLELKDVSIPDIFNQIAAAQTKMELINLSETVFRQLFYYDEFNIYLCDTSGAPILRVFTKNVNMIMVLKGGDTDLNTSYKEIQELTELIIRGERPTVFNLTNHPALSSFEGLNQEWIKAGFNQLTAFPLKTNSATLGAAMFYSKNMHPVGSAHFELIASLCSHIAISLSNLIKDERIAQINFEKSILFEISRGLATVKKRGDLVKVLAVKSRELFPASQCFIGLASNDSATTEFYFKNSSFEDELVGTPEQLLNLKIITSDWTHHLKDKKSLEFPDICTLPQNHWFRAIQNSIGNGSVRSAVVVPLRQERELIGMLVIGMNRANFFKSREVEMIISIAHQINVAADKILINEDIVKKEAEKSLLLSFSNQLAAARDINGLKFIIQQSLNRLFHAGEYIIYVRNNDKKNYHYFLHDPAIREETFSQFQAQDITLKCSLITAVLRADNPVEFLAHEVIDNKNYSIPSGAFWNAIEAKKILGIKLRVADEDVGVLLIHKGCITDRLLKGISAQIAIALANALANEEISRQLSEIQGYKQRLQYENEYLHEAIGSNYSEIIGNSAAMQNTFRMVSQVSCTNSTVLLLGETGTGKELIAKAIHNNSQRKDNLMVRVNCAALPASLIESELFGHEKGSFTGAIDRKIGKFELAHNGTLFLDEIGEMPVELQVKFLRALQEREIERIGGKKPVKINVRIIAATNRDLQKEVSDGRFRCDLFYRLNVFPITLPPLRDRPEDVAMLATYFVKKLNRNLGKQVTGISAEALQEMIAYNWPGNVRELEHFIERSLLLTTGNTITNIRLPSHQRLDPILDENWAALKTIEQSERELIIRALKQCKGKIFGKGGAAQILGVPSSTLNSKMRKLKIKKDLSFDR
ncbi:sigma-54-dependent Fis family transcriptional regulator [Mucilaginibacter aquaedulcis]|uniref:sigma-54-dependent Fis family transcriptional regulator n=1 Tax=Mucilaginibacter aquaedulcis TaxID=1187081 RepID=UPI0025B4978B|nr:sigma 54-interacting transcriptional regulator [Mucilaginibacter aquaedulcis]MDN3546751.1 sigma 54-interacting transcriptional regulator [Mucilaginibacter aquaedulcis]